MPVNFKLYSKQKEFFKKVLNNRYTVFIGGIGSGKTHAGSKISAALTQKFDGGLGLIGTQTSPMIRDTIIPEFLDILPDEWLIDYNKMEKKMLIDTHSGEETKIIFRPLNDHRQIDRIRGLTISWSWIDEITLLPEYAFEVIQGRMREGDEQRFFGTGTPRGFDWVYDKFIDTDDPRYASVRGVRTDDNPFLPDNYVEDLQNQYTEEYLRQEFYGEFVKFQGLVYTEFRDDKHVLSEDEISELDFKDYLAGYDAGYRNPRVLLLIGVTQSDDYVIFDEFYQKEYRLSDALDYFNEIMPEGRTTIYSDPSAKGEIEEMKKAGFTVESADNDVTAGIQKVKEFLEKGNLFVSEMCQNTLDEFNSYRWHDDDNKDKPVKEQDHAMDALRYALYSKDKSKRAGMVSVEL